MKKSIVFLLILAMFIVVGPVLSGCGDDTTEEGDDDDDDDDDSVSAPEDNYAKFVALDEPAEIAFASGDEEYIIFPFSAVTTGDDITVTLEVEEVEANAAAGDDDDDDDDTTEDDDDDSTEAKKKVISVTQNNTYSPIQKFGRIYNNPKLLAKWNGKIAVSDMQERRMDYIVKNDLKKFAGLPTQRLKAGEGCTLSSECADNEICYESECKAEFQMNFMDMSENVSQLACTVAAKGEKIAIIVDEDSTISDDDLTEMVDKFDSILYARDHFFYGASGVEKSDANGDGLVWFLMTQKINDEGVAVGWFDPNDFQPINTGYNNASNHADILYTVVPDASNPLASLYGTIAHEYLHLMHYGIRMEKTPEEKWISEGVAHMMENLSGYGGDNVDAIESFLANFNATSQVFDEDTIEQRAFNLLMVNHMYEEKGGAEFGEELTDKGGAEFLKALVSAGSVGLDNIEGTFGSPLQDWMFDLYVSIAIDTTGENGVLADGKYNFRDPAEDSVTGGVIGLCTNCQMTNSTGDSVDLEGPAFEDFDSSGMEEDVRPFGAFMFKATGEAGIGYKITAGADDESIRLGIIRVK